MASRKAASGRAHPARARAPTIYAAQCAGCHGAAGGGGVGRPLTDGELLNTFPDIARPAASSSGLGSDGVGPAGTVYGDPNREGGPHASLSYNGNKMPTFDGSLTQAELLAVVRYEREVLSGDEIDATQVAADGTMLWPDGTPMLDAARQPDHPGGRAAVRRRRQAHASSRTGPTRWVGTG